MDSRTAFKGAKRLRTAANTNIDNIRTDINQQKVGNRNGKKNNCMDITRDKQRKSHTHKNWT